MKAIWLAGVLVVSGCSGTAAIPNLINGKFYMAGDSNCVSARPLAETRITCFNSQGVETGYRDAMTHEQVLLYRQMLLQRQLANQQSDMDFESTMVVTPPQIVAPQVMPVTLPGSGQVRCISTGFYTNCRY